MNGAWKTFLRWNDYKGRSTRTEFWMYVLCSYVVLIGGLFIYTGIASVAESTPNAFIDIVGGTLFFLVLLAVTLAHLAVAARRLHDIGLSGWWLLLSPVPVLSLGLLVCFFIDSQAGTNRFGPNPKFDDELATTFG